jgi:hypothetical protein
LRKELDNRTFDTGKFNVFKVFDPKERTIHAARFPERVFHHAPMNLCEPVLERQAVFHSYACRKGKGRLAAIEAAEKAARGGAWYLKLDIRKYFESIPQERLIGRLHRLFKDPEILYWLEQILRGHRPGAPCASVSAKAEEEWRRAGCPRHSGPGILSAADVAGHGFPGLSHFSEPHDPQPPQQGALLAAAAGVGDAPRSRWHHRNRAPTTAHRAHGLCPAGALVQLPSAGDGKIPVGGQRVRTG